MKKVFITILFCGFYMVFGQQPVTDASLNASMKQFLAKFNSQKNDIQLMEHHNDAIKYQITKAEEHLWKVPAYMQNGPEIQNVFQTEKKIIQLLKKIDQQAGEIKSKSSRERLAYVRKLALSLIASEVKDSRALVTHNVMRMTASERMNHLERKEATVNNIYKQLLEIFNMLIQNKTGLVIHEDRVTRQAEAKANRKKRIEKLKKNK